MRSPQWPKRPLGELIDLFDHRRVPVNSRERATRKGPYPYYGASGIVDHVDSYIFEGRHILIAEDGENLRSRKTPISFFADGKFWVNNHAHIAKAKRGVADDYYVMIVLEHTDISGFITGAAQPKLTQQNLRLVELPCPPLAAQHRVTDVLSAYDDLIENNSKRIRILEETARSLYREWFVEFRDPGRKDRKLVLSAIGKVPDGWDVGRLDAILTLQRGFDLPVGSRRAGGVPVFAATGKIGTHDEAKVRGPGVLTGRSGSLGAVNLVLEDFWPLNTALWVKEFRWGGPVFAYFVLDNLELRGLDGGAAVPTLNRNDVHALLVPRPPRDLVAHFEACAEPLIRQRDVLGRCTATLRATRDLLLPRLISGEIELGP
jgi:type I restriction enzyme S subunit